MDDVLASILLADSQARNLKQFLEPELKFIRVEGVQRMVVGGGLPGLPLHDFIVEAFKQVIKESGPEFRGSVVAVNGRGDFCGWDVISECRSIIGNNPRAHFVIVKTHRLKVRCSEIISSGKSIHMDWVRKSAKSAKYWYEFKKDDSSAILSRASLPTLKIVAYVVGGEKDVVGQKVVLLIPCSIDNFSKLAREFIEAEAVFVDGMLVQASVSERAEQDIFFPVMQYRFVEESYEYADCILSRLRDWRDLAFREAGSDELLFPEDVSYAMWASVGYSRRKKPAFNTIFFGPSNHGKTSVLRFMVEEVLGGKFEAATASSGKKWMVSHKEGVDASILFSEKVAFLADEMLKSSQQESKSPYGGISSMFQKHMQVVEKDYISAHSGNGEVQGRMSCSFTATENPKDMIQKVLGLMLFSEIAHIKRFSFGWAERRNFSRGIDQKLSMVQKSRDIVFVEESKRLYRLFGRHAKRGIRDLILYIRHNWLEGSISSEEMVSMKKRLFAEAINPSPLVPSLFPYFSEEDWPMRDEEIADILSTTMGDVIDAAWVWSAAIRGCESCNSLATFHPVFDEKQRDLAYMLARFLFSSELKICKSGIDSHISNEVGAEKIQRTQWGE